MIDRGTAAPEPTRGAGGEGLRVFVVDDHPIVRDGLTNLIESQPDMAVCGGARSGEEALATLGEGEADVVIVDLALPGMDGITLIRHLKAEHPEILVLVVSMLEQAIHAERALTAGASGFVTKADATVDVVAAIRKIVQGELFVSEGLAMDIIGDLLGGGQESLRAVERELTNREFEVFRLIGKGLGTRDVADTLTLSVKTIETHQANIKRKLGLRDARELAYYARRWRELDRPGDDLPFPSDPEERPGS